MHDTNGQSGTLTAQPSLRGRSTAPRLINASRVGEANRARVLEALHVGGPASRAQLARALGINRATIATILQPLIDSGVLEEGDPVTAPITGGKPARPLWFSHSGPLLGSVQITPDGVAAALLGFDGKALQQASQGYARDEAWEAIRAAIEQVTDFCLSGSRIIGIGVAASGMVNSTTGTIISMHLNPGLDGRGVGEMLTARFGVPALVDHHPRVQALGDRWFGLGRELNDFASVYTGEALGLGIVQNGHIARGPDGAGGEAGHTTVQIDGARCRCGKDGCWETVATLAWLRAEAERLRLPGAASMTSATLAAQAEAGSTSADQLMDIYARNLAIGLANNEQVLASGTYIIHGDACSGGEAMRKAIQGWLVRLSPQRGAAPTVMFAASPDNITLLGGGGLVLSSVFATTA